MIADPLWLIGLIWVWFMGWAASSYASNFAYRLPRSESPFGREPYCGDCNHSLSPKDLFPIFSWLATGGKCRYCGAKVPFLYFLLELIYPFYSVLCYVAFGYGDLFLLLAGLGMMVQITVTTAWEDAHFNPLIASLMIMGGLIYHLMQGYLLLDGLLHSFLLLFIGVALNGIISRQAPQKEVTQWPRWIWLFAVAGAWLNTPLMIVNFLLTALLGALLLMLLADKKLSIALLTTAAPALLIALWLPIVTG